MNHVGDKGSERVSLLGPKSILQGDFATTEELVILGEVEGTRVQSPHITVGPKAKVRADLYGDRIRIEGHVTGDVHATVSVVVQASATVLGDLHGPEITVREGATLLGAVNPDSSQAASAAEAAGHVHRVRSARTA